jgi:hypothetical protein
LYFQNEIRYCSHDISVVVTTESIDASNQHKGPPTIPQRRGRKPKPIHFALDGTHTLIRTDSQRECSNCVKRLQLKPIKILKKNVQRKAFQLPSGRIISPIRSVFHCSVCKSVQCKKCFQEIHK